MVANVPGGVVTIANLRDNSVRRGVRIAAAASLVLPSLLGAGLGFWLLRGESAPLQHMALSFVAGMLLLVTIEDLVPRRAERQATLDHRRVRGGLCVVRADLALLRQVRRPPPCVNPT